MIMNKLISRNTCHEMSTHVCKLFRYKECLPGVLSCRKMSPYSTYTNLSYVKSKSKSSVFCARNNEFLRSEINYFQAKSISNLMKNNTGSINVHKSCIHTNCSLYCNGTNNEITITELPDFLKESMIEIDDNDAEDLDEDPEMEEEITDFFSWRNIPYEEQGATILISCPSCSRNSVKNHPIELCVDKNTGTYLCPCCCADGEWEDLCSLLDNHADSMTQDQLDMAFESLLPVDEKSMRLYNTLYRSINVETFKKFNCRMSPNGESVVIPVYRNGKVVGFYTVSLTNKRKNVVARFLKNQGSVWSSLTFDEQSCEEPILPNNDEEVQNSTANKLVVTDSTSTTTTLPLVVVVSDICEALYLTQSGIHALSIPGGVNWDASMKQNSTKKTGPLTSVWGLYPDTRQVVVWLTQPLSLPYRFFAHLHRHGIPCSTVNSANHAPLYTLKSRLLLKHLKLDLLPLLSDQVLTFEHLQDEIFHRITHRRQVHGVEFKRFSDLQKLLLGHRRAEVTVLSGPTGAGKTTFMAEYSLDLAMQNVSTLWLSLEVSVVRLAEVLLQQFCGSPFPHRKKTFKALASDFRQLPLCFMNLHGQQEIDQIIQSVRALVVTRGVRHVIVDNLQFLVGCKDSNGERWAEQDRAMAAFRSFATAHQCHVTLIVHPKKTKGDEPLTMQSVGGGARVTQEADNVLLLQVLQSNNGQKKSMQVVKNRYGGHLGHFPLKFHPASLTMSGWFVKEKKRRFSPGAKNKSKPKKLEE